MPRAGARRARLSAAGRTLAGVAILVALGVALGADAVRDGLRAVGPAAVLAALGIGLGTIVLNAGRWCLVARGLGLPLRLRTAVADCYRAALLNSVLPAGVLGDVHRAVDHGRRAGDLRRGVRAVALERAAGFAVLVAVGLGVLVGRPGLRAGLPGLATAAVAVLALGIAALRVPRVRAAVSGLPAGTWPAVLLLSVLALAGYLALFVVAARAAGSQAPIGELLPLLVLALAAMGLPVNVGGWGPREAAAAVGFGTAGLDPAQGLAAAVVFGTLSLVACLPGAAVLVLQCRSRRSAPTGWCPVDHSAAPAAPGGARRRCRRRR